ncbi:protein of unknown function (plasmid) [Azospirillum baldaniorum]|uniref:Uncharacterized protein n=1 Tax=Azospirillum baldaniorum TaxID=1064539 RepID=A0A9P1NNG9_9PROT|nr:protein of unknown function [Azospirillum baldaniorum]
MVLSAVKSCFDKYSFVSAIRANG